jgi:transcriptional regulator with XRE-family HTH domain
MSPEGKSRSKSRNVAIMDAEVPQRLRTERTRKGLSIRELARRLDVSASAISQIETGRTRPSVSMLYSIVTELGLSLDELFHSDGPSASPRSGDDPPGAGGTTSSELVQRAESRVTIDLDTGVRWERLTPSPDPVVDFLFVTYPPGSTSSPNGLTRHPGQEFGLILSGQMEVTVGFETQTLSAGDSIRFDSMTPHRLTNTGTAPVTGIWVVVGRGGDMPSAQREVQRVEGLASLEPVQ